ncbi:MAG: sugar kinase [Candidatus Omnitrophica bacterium]|nr:sugar kinase [Candidatus Omnitrophota bacterium]
MRLTVLGSTALDSIETPFGNRKEILGGSATYASVSASFFTPVNLMSVVGSDFPARYLSMFDKRGIDTSSLEIKKGKTFRWKAKYNYDMSVATTLSTKLGVFDGYMPEVPDSLSSSCNLLLANIDPDLQNHVLKKLKPAGLVACDTMNLWIDLKKRSLLKLLKKVDLLLLNDAEARQLSGEEGLFAAAKWISSKGVKMVVIKKGEHGALFFSKKLGFIVPAYLLEVIKDPTGAGDTFAGAMMGYLSRCRKINDRNLRRGLVYGTIMSSFAVERFSADGLIKTTPKDIRDRYSHFEKLTRF